MRKYEPIWRQIKAAPEGKAIRIAAPKIWHNRIWKAVIKEKDEDIIFKLQQAELGRKAKLSIERFPGEIRITMNYSISLEDFK